MNYIEKQAKHYDKHQGLYPWPEILSKTKLNITYKPREVFLFKEIKRLGINSKSKLLDFGCGIGITAKRISDQYKNYTKGIDISTESIKYANKNYSNDSLSYKLIKTDKTSFNDKNFDFVISLDVLEHIEDQQGLVIEFARILKKKGKVLIYTLNKFDKYSLDWIWEKLGINIYKRAMHKRKLFVDIDILSGWLESSGFTIKEKKYYGGLFTIFLDEVIMISILIFEKIGLYKYKILGKLYLYLLNQISKNLFPILNIIDHLWYKKGYSLGILVVAEKK